MSVWDKTTPIGSEAISLGDDRIRELKDALEVSLQANGSFPGPSPSTSPTYFWTGSRGNTASRPASPVTGQIYFNTQLFQMEYWSGSAWTLYDLVPLLAIITSKINDLAVTTAKVNDLAVTTSKLGALSVTDAKVNDVAFGKITGTVTPSDGTVTNAKLGASAVTDAKVNDVAAGKITGTVVTSQIGAAQVTEAKLDSAVVNKLGQNIGLIARVTASTSSTSFVDIVNVSTQGRLNGITGNKSGGAGTGEISISIDGIAHAAVTSIGSTSGRILYGPGQASVMFQFDTATLGVMNDLNAFFRTTLQVQHRTTVSGTMTTFIQYERAA